MPSSRYTKISDESYHDEDIGSSDGQHGGHLRRSDIEESSPKWGKKLRSLKWSAVFLLLSIIAGCELFKFSKQPAPVQVLGELNNLIPDFSTRKVLFRPQPGYMSDHKTKDSMNVTFQNWVNAMPRGSGFIEVKDWEKYTLPPPITPLHPGEPELHAIAVYHQLHCLYRTMAYIDKILLQVEKGGKVDVGDVGHLDHCFSYLRNTILCCGDTTLEGQSPVGTGTDGTGAIHVCRNMDEIDAWTERNRIDDAKGI